MWLTPDRRLVGAVIGVVAMVALYLALPASRASTRPGGC